MVKLVRHPQNPIISPNRENEWESGATYNASVVKFENKYYMTYRAFDSEGRSRIGLAVGETPVSFSDRRLFIKPEYAWEEFGCEDPRVTKIADKYFIAYTAISTWPPSADGIKVGMAITSDFKILEEKHPVTTFNSKALGFFPEKVSGKYAAILAANTDKPPSKISIAYFNDLKEIWDTNYWNSWYSKLEEQTIEIPVKDGDHIEVGAAPLKVEGGWLLIYCYIENYFSDAKGWRIDALLLDENDPKKILGRTIEPLLYPNEDYEIYGNVYNLIFPSGALIEDDTLYVYYGGADTVTCVASCKVSELITDIKGKV